jgi:hypothetical protein
VHALRLAPGDDLRGALQNYARQQGISAGFILSALGSLDAAAIRYANADNATLIAGPLEIITLSGTLAPDGVHLHVAVADAAGHVCGGHLCAGSAIRTTAEIVIGSGAGLRFSRQHDPRTGYRELQVASATDIAPRPA